MVELPLLGLAVFVLNVIPAFAPPTWVAVSLFGLRYHDSNPLVLAAVAAPAATAGRIVLAKLSTRIVRNKLLGDATRANIDVVRKWLERKAAATAGATLVFAFSPFPSNTLFIAYGLTSLRLRVVAPPFLVGRFLSYAGWSWAARSLASHLSVTGRDPGAFLNGYFVAGQLGGIALLIIAMRLDWAALIGEHKVRFLRRRAHP